MSATPWDSVSRACYEAHVGATVGVDSRADPMPAWHDLPDPVRRAWVESSIAVAMAVSTTGRAEPPPHRSPALSGLDADGRQRLMQDLEAAVERRLPEGSLFAVVVLDGPDLMTHVCRRDAAAVARGLRDGADRVELAARG